MPSHPDRVRRHYVAETTPREQTIHYVPCDRYTDHVFIDGACFMCHRTEAEIASIISGHGHDRSVSQLRSATE